MKTRTLLIIGLILPTLLGIIQYVHADDCHYVTRYAPCIDSKYFDHVNTDPNFSGIDPKFTLAELSWEQAIFPIKNGTGFVTAILKDPDLNKDANYKETANVFVYSDSDPELHVIELQETEFDSGMFERKLGISNSRSAPNVILTQEGDTMGVMYVDFTMPPGHFSSDSSLISTTLIGSTGPPLERALASNARILDVFGNSIVISSVGEQIQITSDIANQQNREQKFAYLVMIQDDTGATESLSWIDGVLNPESYFSPSSSWIPQKEGDYVATMFVWESIYNPTALSPPIQIEFSVKKENTKKTVWDPDDPQCIGDALCLSETIVRIVDGDTLYLKGGYEVRLSLTNTPERYELGFHNASQFTAKICPVTMTAVFDQDDGQPYDVYGRLVGKITCNGNVLNSELLYAGHANILKQYCSTSEFSDESWAKEFGC